MSKITFRADDELIEQLETFDASKSEVMRDALRAYLDGAETDDAETTASTVDLETIDELVAARVDEAVGARTPRTHEPRDVNVNISLETDSEGTEVVQADRKTAAKGRDASADAERATQFGHDDGPNACAQCGEDVGADHVYCPNCGEKTARRVFCDCGDELRSDWAFCPSCGRRTPAADVLDRT